MPVNQPHPLYTLRQQDWQQMSDTHQGQRAVKEAGDRYLPPTDGMIIDGMQHGEPGALAYEAYKKRAVFHNLVKEAVEAMVGIMHREQARIEVPERMKPMLEKITVNGESVQMLLRKMNEWQLLYGRCGLLVEAPTGVTIDKAMPYIALYSAPAILNWDIGERAEGRQGLEFVTLNESNFERTAEFQWKFVNRFRVVAMSDAVTDNRQNLDNQQGSGAGGVYQVQALAPNVLVVDSEKWVTPSIGNTKLTQIPFIFVGTKDLASDPDDPPLLGLSDLCLAIYRGEADYRQTLYLQGQETFVVTGADVEDKDRLGAGAKLSLPRDAKAAFVGVSPNGLNAMRTSIRDDMAKASEMTTILFDSGSQSAGTAYQSGEALRIRISAKTATLRSIAETGAEALKQALQIIARWIGEDDTKITVEPNTDFAEVEAASRTLLELMQSKQLGAPLSDESVHRFMVRQDLTIKTFDEEKTAIKEEPPPIPASPGVQGLAGGVLGASTGGARVGRGVPKKPETAPKPGA